MASSAGALTRCPLRGRVPPHGRRAPEPGVGNHLADLRPRSRDACTSGQLAGTPVARDSSYWPPASVSQRLVGLKKRIQPADDEHPAAGDTGGRLGRAFQPVVHHGQLRNSTGHRLDLPGHPARRFRRQLWLVERPPGVDQPARRLRLEDRVIAPEGDPVIPATSELRQLKVRPSRSKRRSRSNRRVGSARARKTRSSTTRRL